MKKLFALIALTLAMSIFMTSCGDDDDSTTGPSELEIGEMTATIEGDTWTALNALYENDDNILAGTFVPDVTNPFTGFSVSVSLKQLDGEPIKNNYIVIGKFIQAGANGTGDVNVWNDNNGTCEVTEVTDTEIRGTYSFNGKNDKDGTTKNVTGSFYLSRQ